MSTHIAGFPTSSDIYLELDGKKVAVVQSYSCKATRTSTAVEAFGEDEPVATIQGPQNHVIELTRLYVTENAIADGLDFYGMRDFSLVICKPDRRVDYSGCHWSGIQESCPVGRYGGGEADGDCIQTGRGQRLRREGKWIVCWISGLAQRRWKLRMGRRCGC